MHPLMIDLIANKVFSFVLQPTGNDFCRGKRHSRDTISTLANVRLVCRLWCKLATLILKDGGHTPKFGGETTERSWKPDSKMESFLRIMKGSKNLPVERYTLNPLVFAEEHNQQLMETFIEVCAPSAVSLDLQFSAFQRAQLRGLDWTLSRLKKAVKSITNRRKRKNALELTEKLLSSAQNLEELSISIPERLKLWFTYNEPMEIESQVKAMFMVIPSTVKALRLDIFALSEQHLNYLSDLNLELRSLHFQVRHIIGYDDHDLAIQNFFNQYCSSLRNLTLFAETFCSFSLSEAILPLQFPNVSRLELESYGKCFKKLPLYRLFPNLLSLNLKNYQPFEEPDVKLLSLEKESQSVEELFLPTQHFISWEEVVKVMARVFPNLKRLHFPLDNYFNKTFEDISVHFPNLQLLTCYDGTVEQTCLIMTSAFQIKLG